MKEDHSDEGVDNNSPSKYDLSLNINDDPTEEHLSFLTERICDDNKIRVINQKDEHLSNFQQSFRLSKGTISYKVITFLDILLSSSVVSFCVIGFWRGQWKLMDLYSEYFPNWPMLTISTIFILIFTVIKRSCFKESVNFQKMEPLSIISRMSINLYVFFFAIMCVTYWRAIWAMMDKYTGLVNIRPDVPDPKTTYGEFILGGLSLFVLAAIKSCKNLSGGSPTGISVDTSEVVFNFPTRYRQNEESGLLFMLDCIYSLTVVGTLVAIVWRAAFLLFEAFLFQDDLVLSSWINLGVGYIVVTTAYFLQYPINILINKTKIGFLRIILADFFILLIWLASTSVWRGIWNLYNIYLYPSNPALSCNISFWFSWIVLVLLGCSTSILSRGACADSSKFEEKFKLFDSHYLRLMLQAQHTLIFDNLEINQQEDDQREIDIEVKIRT